MKSIRLSGGSSRDCVAAVQEATLLSRLKHPNIVAYKESFQDGGGEKCTYAIKCEEPLLSRSLLLVDTLHIVMEYCKGGDLCSRLKSYRGQLLSETQVVEWFVQIALALQVSGLLPHTDVSVVHLITLSACFAHPFRSCSVSS